MVFYGQWNPPVDLVLYENYFKNTPKGFFVDCGASDGVLHSCTKFFEDCGWDGICIEPSVAFKELIVNRKVNCLNLALSDKIGEVQFNEAVHAKGSKAGLPPGGAVEYVPELKRFVTSFGYEISIITVPTTTYKALNLPSIDLLVVDVEGYEEAVIKGMYGTLLPKVICIEYTVTGIKKVTRLLTGLYYKFDFISYNNAFFSLGMNPTKFGETKPMGCLRDE